MLSRAEFPYLQSFFINDAYAVKNLAVPIFEGAEFKHLILTGKNGSGKTTVLQEISHLINYDTFNHLSVAGAIFQLQGNLNRGDSDDETMKGWRSALNLFRRVTLVFSKNINSGQNHFTNLKNKFVLAFFEATRKVILKDVQTITKEADLITQLAQNNSDNSPAALFKQYLVNKKVFQVFDVMEGNNEVAQQQEKFFAELEIMLREIFDAPQLKLEFVRENFEFYIRLEDGRRITFNQLSAGFSAFLSILTDLLLRTDILRKQANDYTYDPCGFVFIDEPETHLHLEMQYQVLPWLTRLFPNLQFIVATHSPAVASSIKNATVFDLTTGQVLGDTAAGSSYSELMLTHFGVKDEYSNVADGILASINRIVALPDAAQAKRELQALLEAQGRFMSAGLLLEVEAQLIGLQGA